MVAEGAHRRNPSLLHRDRSQRRKAHHVARGIDVRHFGLVVFVHGDAAAFVRFQAGGGQVQVVHIALPAHRVEQRVT